MRTFLFSCTLLLCAPSAFSQDFGLYWKYKDYDGVALTVPAFVVEMGSWFLDEKQDRTLVRTVNKVRVMYFENGSPVSERDLRRFTRKAKRRHLEDMVMVREGKQHVHVMAKERRNALRKIVVLVQSPGEFAMVSIRGHLRWDDINRLMDKYGKGKGADPKITIPPAIKLPVKKT